MRSRSALEHAGVLLGAATEGIWCGAAAAALTRQSWPPLALFSAATVAAAAYVARRMGATPRAERRARGLLVTVIVVAAGVLLVAGRGWEHQYLVWQIVRDVAFASGLAFLGVHLAREADVTETAVRRAIRAFALLCAVIACAASVGSTPAWAGAAVVAALVAGGLLVAVVRYRTLVELVADADRLPAWPWLLAVTGTVVGVVAVAALLNGLIGVDVLRWALDALGALLGYVLGALAWAIGWAGAGVLWLVRWLLGLIHVKAPSTGWTPPHAPKAPTIVPRPEDSWLAAGITRLIATVVGATAAIVGSLAVVVLALRRMRRRRPAEAVVEERESLGSLRSAAGAFVGGLGRRLGRLAAARRRRPLTPAEEVRRLYAQLERRLTTAGQPRLPGVTVREYLAAVLTADGASHDTASPAADLAATYELARYSAHALDPGQSRRFADLARGSSPRAT